MLSALIALSVVLLDMVSKYLVVQLLIPIGADVIVIPHLISFSYVENRGAAFGMLAENRWVFMLASVILIVAIILLLCCSQIKHPLFLTSTALILGGGLGNMIDRVFLGYVVDFIKTEFIDFPVFNVADSAVVIGTILLAVYIVFFDKSFFKKKEEENNN